MRPICLALTVLVALTGESRGTPEPATQTSPEGDLEKRLANFVPVTIRVDSENLPASEREALRHLTEASKLMSEIFLRQAYAKNPTIQKSLKGDALDLFKIHVGLWDRLDGEPILGDQPRPETAGYYPIDLTEEEFQSWVEAHPEQKEALESLFTVVVRKDGGLDAIPYSEYYREWLEPAAEHLRSAATATENESLRRFLNSRADAFLDDDYYQSDMDWMDLDGVVEITIGPYETYEDRLFGYKAAFESFLTIADPDASARLDLYKSQLPAMEMNLPIPDEFKNTSRGTESPIRVVDVYYTGGDTRAGVQTIAYNLPNDERVREAKGSKKVLLRNVIQAKYKGILKPIAAEMLAPDQADLVDPEAFTNQTLFHELAHGLGPGKILKDGEETEVRMELKELYSPLEEAKADIMGVYNQLFMVDEEILPEDTRNTLFPTWLAGLFRSIRFGTEEAHGKANLIQFNYMLEAGAITRDSTSGKYEVVFEQFDDATTNLVRDICLLQANGDYEGTRSFFNQYGEMSPTLKKDLQRLDDVPVDIRPTYGPERPIGSIEIPWYQNYLGLVLIMLLGFILLMLGKKR